MSASEEAGRARPAASGASDDAVARTAPLSFAQQGLWLAERLHPGEPTYNEPVALRLTGALDVLALRRALNDVVRRHEALRTRFGLANSDRVLAVSRWLDRVEAKMLALHGLPGPSRSLRESGAQDSGPRALGGQDSGPRAQGGSQ